VRRYSRGTVGDRECGVLGDGVGFIAIDRCVVDWGHRECQRRCISAAVAVADGVSDHWNAAREVGCRGEAVTAVCVDRQAADSADRVCTTDRERTALSGDGKGADAERATVDIGGVVEEVSRGAVGYREGSILGDGVGLIAIDRCVVDRGHRECQRRCISAAVAVADGVGDDWDAAREVGRRGETVTAICVDRQAADSADGVCTTERERTALSGDGKRGDTDGIAVGIGGVVEEVSRGTVGDRERGVLGDGVGFVAVDQVRR